MDPDEIAVVVVYRPVIVDGDVAKPGEQAFRPSMTVREAIALSGGYDALRVGHAAADLRADSASFWIEFAIQSSRLWRLKTDDQRRKLFLDNARVAYGLAG
jgi:polysaccharide export outer membrane protein